MTALTCSPSLACCPSGTIPWTPPGDNFLVLAPKYALSSDWLSNINILPPWPNIRGTIPLTIDFTFIKNYWYTWRKKKYECNRSKGDPLVTFTLLSCLCEESCWAVTPGSERPPDMATAPVAASHIWLLNRLPLWHVCHTDWLPSGFLFLLVFWSF